MDRVAYTRHYELDKAHFWREGKRELVLRHVRAELGDREGAALVDIGGACSVVTQELGDLGDLLVLEPDAEIAAQARAQLGVRVELGALPDALPLADGSVDLVTLLDVLEHIDDDAASLATIRRLLRPGGLLVLTVPAYAWLWSEHDEALHHKRRYTQGELRRLLEAAGFEVERMTYYTSLLLPLIAAQRALQRLRPRSGPPRYRVKVPSGAVNRALAWVMRAERWLLGRTDLPAGSAILALARRPR
ncbi:MAG: methyltransferase domain-containing protein [Nannocystaceae bacterium]